MSNLGRKQHTDNQAWLDAFLNIESLVSRDELDALVKETVLAIQETVAGKTSAYAWSGGKDSIVLGKICEMAGVNQSMIGICDLEYPAFLKWVQEHKPDGCEVINTGQGLEWLAKHPAMLFPQESATAAHWFTIVQHRAQRIFVKNRKVDILILGRRRADGNYVGKQNNIYTDGKGVTRFSPLADWKHEHILAFIHYHSLPLPPIYDWHNGFLCGTHPWPARPKTGSEENGWREVYNIDPDVVRTAAELLPGAKAFMEVAENGHH